ncbi:MAG: hypothetical protein GF353_08430 [Candidatus Lokiarchaeota archaeon]|nr:hypothetical protein [Candidatus Lokiarchaeota archaeon]
MKLNKLLNCPKNLYVFIIVILGLFSYLYMTFIIFTTIEIYLQSKSGYGVIEFELAWTSENIDKIFRAWGQEGKKKQIYVTIVDFFYIPAYVFFMSGTILLLIRNLNGKIQDLGVYFTLLPFLAAAFDVIENINLLLMLTNEAFVWSPCPFIASFCATIKFLLLFATILFFFVGLIALIVQKVRK